MEHVSHDASHRRLTRSGITRKDIVLALELIGLSTMYLQVEERSQIGYFLLHGSQSHQTV